MWTRSARTLAMWALTLTLVAMRTLSVRTLAVRSLLAPLSALTVWATSPTTFLLRTIARLPLSLWCSALPRLALVALAVCTLPVLSAAMRTASSRTIAPPILFGRLPPLGPSGGAASMSAVGLRSTLPAALLVVASTALRSDLGAVRMLRLTLIELRYVRLYGLTPCVVRIKILVLRVLSGYVVGIDRRRR